MSKQRNEALFLGTDLADPGPGKAYQLWTLDAQKNRFPDAMVRGYGRTQKWFSGPVGPRTALAVTIEPAEGSQSPTPPSSPRLPSEASASRARESRPCRSPPHDGWRSSERRLALR